MDRPHCDAFIEIFQLLQLLNYFRLLDFCLIYYLGDARCELSMGHVLEGRSHSNSKCCRYQKQYENSVYLCKHCHLNGRQVICLIHLFFAENCDSSLHLK